MVACHGAGDWGLTRTAPMACVVNWEWSIKEKGLVLSVGDVLVKLGSLLVSSWPFRGAT